MGANDKALMIQSIKGASQSWGIFDLSGKRGQFDAILSQSKEAREQSVAARKKLADTTKQLKRSVKSGEQASNSLVASNGTDPSAVNAAVKAMESLAKECRVTVKSYQEEIDKLTKRCKTSEQGFSNLCQALEGVPDPTTVLEACVNQIQEQQAQLAHQEKLNQSLKKELAASEQKLSVSQKQQQSSTSSSTSKAEKDELVQLRREVSEYEVEFRSLKNQDITIRKLEARIAELQMEGEEKLNDQLEKAKEELAETEGRRASEALEREAAMERKVQTLELQLKAEKAGAEATQAHLLDADEGVSQREAAWDAQKRILVDDADRLRDAMQSACRERDELRLQVAATLDKKSVAGGVTSPPSGGVAMADLMLERKAYEAEVAELSESAMILREELRLKEESINEEKRAAKLRMEALIRENESLNSNLVSLEAQLASAPSPVLVESMKRELRILKRLEYNADDIDAERDPEMTGGLEEEKDLESVLVAKLHRAESDLVSERVRKAELSEELKSVRLELVSSKAAKEDAEKLIAKLEQDLEKVITTSPVKNKSTVAIPEPTLAAENPAALRSILDPEAQPLPPAPAQQTNDDEVFLTPLQIKSSSEKAEDDHSVATIVMAQRDRLRARCESLEAERDSFKRELQNQVQASDSLKIDNTKLYEKVRYLQDYNKAPANRRVTYGGRGADRDLDLEALEQRYEASVDPFRQFSKTERQRKLSEMSPMERAVYIVAKTVLGTKEMRTGLFFYVVSLHLLVFITTYHWSHQGCQSINNDYLSFLPPDHQMPIVQKSDAAPASAAGAKI